MLILDTGINDRGSKYAVSGGLARSRAEIQAFLVELKREKRFARATHNSWAAFLADGGPLKGDDGEAGAGNVILQHLQASGLADHLIVVTRWYGGKHLGGDRFRNVAEAVRLYLSSLP
ncbi:YigZ family protein [Frigidibacter sp. RF13]|uniref:YigZ family protein n=1 Tax=Frigidibacter sp. RF13 TaxID=2997340 RepID=UPI002271AD93|nr:YigZ family protein [Frigidibacter sp. RF13]MCY1126297.1 YigZ family protein [Frigidibacter sp. RF13]